MLCLYKFHTGLLETSPLRLNFLSSPPGLGYNLTKVNPFIRRPKISSFSFQNEHFTKVFFSDIVLINSWFAQKEVARVIFSLIMLETVENES